MEWTRTGKITMRSGDFLIIKYPTHYLALHGPQTDRKTIGRYPSAQEAKEACDGFDSLSKGGGNLPPLTTK